MGYVNHGDRPFFFDIKCELCDNPSLPEDLPMVDSKDCPCGKWEELNQDATGES